MKTRILSICIVIVASLVVVVAVGYAQKGRTTWEYMITGYQEESQLNRLGSDGWELAAAYHPGGTAGVTLYFKRRK
jgi:hypothetical protein